MPLLQLAIGAIAESSRDVEPEVWRRMMSVLIDGLRAESATTELEPPALEPDAAPGRDGVLRARRAGAGGRLATDASGA